MVSLAEEYLDLRVPNLTLTRTTRPGFMTELRSYQVLRLSQGQLHHNFSQVSSKLFISNVEDQRVELLRRKNLVVSSYQKTHSK